MTNPSPDTAEHAVETSHGEDTRTASWSCTCGASGPVRHARPTGARVAQRIARMKADNHLREHGIEPPARPAATAAQPEYGAMTAARPGDPVHSVRQEGDAVVITYDDKRYPSDVACWAFANGHASDPAAANVIARL